MLKWHENLSNLRISFQHEHCVVLNRCNHERQKTLIDRSYKQQNA
jgi:hypothetical protein